MTRLDPPTTPRQRRWRERAVDATLHRLVGLPPPTSDVTVSLGLRVPMRDGVTLVADVYHPTGPARGSVLMRGPYGRSGVSAGLMGRLYAQHGYHVVVQSCRGTFGSGGTFRPAVDEVADGADTVAWLRGQPWFAGRLATLGASYLGFTQWALLVDPPPELVGSVIVTAPYDFPGGLHGTGAFTLTDFLGWSDLVAGQERYGQLQSLARGVRAERRLAPVVRELPLADAGERYLAGGAPWYRQWATRRDPADPVWDGSDLRGALETARTPVHLVGGWQDVFLHQTIGAYARLHARGQDVTMTIGPWTHLDLARSAAGPVARETLAFLDRHLAGQDAPERPEPVRINVTGADEWCDLPAWPPPTTEHVVYLHSHGRLFGQPPTSGAPTVGFTYDPTDPTPTLGGRLLSPGLAGRRDDRPLAQRDDVLVFDGPVLTRPLEVVGTPVVRLRHESDTGYGDLFVRLGEVEPSGRSRNVSDGFVRLPASSGSVPVTVELDAMAHRFGVGSRVRLLVAGGSFPRYERNLGTGLDPATSSQTAVSRRTITVVDGASTVTLPVLG